MSAGKKKFDEAAKRSESALKKMIVLLSEVAEHLRLLEGTLEEHEEDHMLGEEENAAAAQKKSDQTAEHNAARCKAMHSLVRLGMGLTR